MMMRWLANEVATPATADAPSSANGNGRESARVGNTKRKKRTNGPVPSAGESAGIKTDAWGYLMIQRKPARGGFAAPPPPLYRAISNGGRGSRQSETAWAAGAERERRRRRLVGCEAAGGMVRW